MSDNKKYISFDDYFSKFPIDVQEKLQKIRQLVKSIVPEATEKISYQIPTFYYQGNLVHFAAFKTHIGFYPTPSGIEKFKDILTDYKISKGSVQFPHNKEIPYDIIDKIVRYRLSENLKLHDKL